MAKPWQLPEPRGEMLCGSKDSSRGDFLLCAPTSLMVKFSASDPDPPSIAGCSPINAIVAVDKRRVKDARGGIVAQRQLIH